MLSDLIGEVQEVHPVSNISTAADLLKQGAGMFSILPSLPKTHCCVTSVILLLYEFIIFYILQP